MTRGYPVKKIATSIWQRNCCGLGLSPDLSFHQNRTVSRMVPPRPSGSWLRQLGRVVPRLLVELFRLVHDVGLVNLLGPVLRLDLLHRDRDGLLPVTQHVRHALRDQLGEPGLLLLRLPGPEF